MHVDDRQWVQRPHQNINFWDGKRKQLRYGITLYNLGGHFEGGTILHWQQGGNGKGTLLTGDILQVVSVRNHVSFMYNYPNHIPLNKKAIQQMTTTLEPVKYDRIYRAWWDRNIVKDGKQILKKSAQRYINAISENE